jgi:hypothetical protein
MRGQGKNPPPRKRKAPLSKRGASSRFSATPTQPAQVSTYAPTHASKSCSQPLFSSFRLRLAMWPPVGLGSAVADPVGRAAPWLVQ